MIRNLILFFVCMNATMLLAQQSDYSQVEQTLNYYLDGGTNNDFEVLEKAFHKDATMKFIGKDGYTERNALELFRNAIKPGPPQNRTTRIAFINIAGNAATARLEIDYPTFSFNDYMSLLKIDGEWKIVSKVFYRRNASEK